MTDEPVQNFTLDVRGSYIELKAYYNDIDGAWYADFTNEEGVIMPLGEKLVSGVDIGFKFGVEGIYIAKLDGTFQDPGPDGWSDLYFYILEEDELGQKDTAFNGFTYLVDDNNNPLYDDFGNLLVGDEL